MKVTVTGRASGMPVVVHGVSYDGEEYQCPECDFRSVSQDMMIAHVVEMHPKQARGENPQ